MTCHCFLRPIRRELTSSSYATQMINCMITFLVNFQIILAKKKKKNEVDGYIKFKDTC